MRVRCRSRSILTRAMAGTAALAISATAAHGGDVSFSDVIVFGDSLSDNGNFYALTGGFIPISPPNYQGRFSNGPVWVELLTPQFGVDADAMTDYAIGGSTTFDVLDVQIAEHAELGATPDDALHVFWAGANDFFASETGDPIEPLVSDAMTYIEQSISTLAGLGATSFLMPNLPDLALTPRYINDQPDDAARAHAFSLAFNEALGDLVISLGDSLSVDIYAFDTFALMNDIVADPEAYGFSNVTDRALLITGYVVDDPDSYLFWDDVHPTGPAHAIMADAAAALIPAPSVLSLLLIGLMVRGPRSRT